MPSEVGYQAVASITAVKWKLPSPTELRRVCRQYTSIR